MTAQSMLIHVARAHTAGPHAHAQREREREIKYARAHTHSDVPNTVDHVY